MYNNPHCFLYPVCLYAYLTPVCVFSSGLGFRKPRISLSVEAPRTVAAKLLSIFIRMTQQPTFGSYEI